MSDFLVTLIHLLSIANFSYAVYWDLFILDVPTQKSFGGQWKYLTFINMVLQLIYFSISFLNNFFGSNALDRDNSTTLQKIRDFIFATLGFPIGQFVGIVFWTLFYIDRELVFPEVLDKLFPNYINHMMHTTVIPAQLLELILLYHIYPSRLKGMATSYLFCLVYLVWIMIVAFVGGIWVYPILKILDPVPRAAFMFTCSLFGAFLYLCGEGLNNMVWGKHVTSEQITQSQNHQTGVVTRSKTKRPQKVD